MQETYILDTNVFLFDPQALEHFPGNQLLIPLEVVEEIDRFKHDSTETGHNARQVAHVIDRLRVKGSLRDGVRLANGSTLRIVADENAVVAGGDSHAAAAILRLGKQFQEAGLAPVIITQNVNLRVKADALGLEARDYEQAPVRDTNTLRGWQVLEMEAPQLEMLRSGQPLRQFQGRLQPNEYVYAKLKGQPKIACCARYYAENDELWPLADTTRVVCGIRSLNVEQTFTLDALLDESIKLVTLAGKAGTGKTLLAMAAGLQQIFADNRYQRLLVFRPTMPVSRDLGYLPGDLSEKMRPWMQPVFDALDFIRSQDKKCPARTLPNDVMSCPEISVEPLTYIRGRSIPNQYIIIDEAQNLTPLEVKTVITRVGAGSKIILTGDPDQIDNPYVNAYSNGLTRLVDKFLPSPLSAHVTLIRGERSELAETAAMLL
ncbi:MAG: PhoH family protein [Lentisphaerae bacterium]|nr:PhoH family protein [Lentisphaerota bacterium]